MAGIVVNVKECEELAPGVLKKNSKTYYIQCVIAKTWHYCNAERLEKLIKRFGDAELVGANYVSREAKQQQKEKDVKRRLPTLERGKYESNKAFMARRALARQEAEQTVREQTSEKRTYTYLPKPPFDTSNININGGEIKARTQHAFDLMSKTDEGTFVCIHPSTIEKNSGYCNDCPWWNSCRVGMKEWKKFAEQPRRWKELKDNEFKSTEIDYEYNVIT